MTPRDFTSHAGRIGFLVCALVLPGAVYVFERSGTTWSQTARLEAESPAFQGDFGSSVAIDGTTIVVGAPGDDGPASDGGAAYVFVLDAGNWVPQARLVGGVRRGAASVYVRVGGTWTLQGTLSAGSGSGPGDRFGDAVGLSGDTAIVGVPRDDGPAGSDQGTVRLFTRTGSTWGGEVVVVGSAPEANARLGAAVTVNGGTALVAAFRTDATLGLKGSTAAYVQLGANWIEQAVFVAVDPAGLGYFGESVSLDGETAVVGAQFADGGAFSSGAAYVYVRSGALWTEQQKLEVSDAQSFEDIGSSAAVSGNTIVIGNRADGTFGMEAGAAYVFERSGTLWTEQVKLVSSDGGFSDLLGIAVAIEGDTIVVGASGKAGVGFGSGAAYVFTRQGATWSEQAKLEADDAQALAIFGNSVALSGDTVAIGAPQDPGLFLNAGTTYVFVRTGSTWQQQARLDTSSAAAGDLRGAVGLDGDLLVSGSPQAGGAGNLAVFMRSGTMWTEQALLTASDGESGDSFGLGFESVSVQGDTVLVGAHTNAYGSVHSLRRGEGSWVDLGGGTSGAAGVPVFTGTGSLTAGTAAGLQLTAAPPGALVLVWLSFAPSPQAFGSGTLHALPFANQFLFATDGTGSFALTATWPAGVPAGTQAWFQCVVQDASVPAGLSLSNGLLATTP